MRITLWATLVIAGFMLGACTVQFKNDWATRLPMTASYRDIAHCTSIGP